MTAASPATADGAEHSVALGRRLRVKRSELWIALAVFLVSSITLMVAWRTVSLPYGRWLAGPVEVLLLRFDNHMFDVEGYNEEGELSILAKGVAEPGATRVPAVRVYVEVERLTNTLPILVALLIASLVPAQLRKLTTSLRGILLGVAVLVTQVAFHAVVAAVLSSYTLMTETGREASAFAHVAGISVISVQTFVPFVLFAGYVALTLPGSNPKTKDRARRRRRR